MKPAFRPPLPPYLRVRLASGAGRAPVERLLERFRLHTVCAGARCPNREECFGRRTATFLILGEHCTRSCRFCAIGGEAPRTPPDPTEPERVAAAARELELRYVVITSVTRDDLPDGGAGHFAAVLAALQQTLPEARTEVLTPDFNGEPEPLQTVLAAGPTVFNHNLETVERLTPQVRCRATYRRSLGVLARARELGAGRIPVKSGLMLGLGETPDEVRRTLYELREAGVTRLTLGQYLPPSARHWPLARYLDPAEFAAYRDYALKLGFHAVAAGPLVRSSYRAEELAE